MWVFELLKCLSNTGCLLVMEVMEIMEMSWKKYPSWKSWKCHGFFFNLPKCHGNFIFWHVFTAVVENATFNGLKSKKFSLARNFLMKLNYYHVIFSFKSKFFFNFSF